MFQFGSAGFSYSAPWISAWRKFLNVGIYYQSPKRYILKIDRPVPPPSKSYKVYPKDQSHDKNEHSFILTNFLILPIHLSSASLPPPHSFGDCYLLSHYAQFLMAHFKTCSTIRIRVKLRTKGRKPSKNRLMVSNTGAASKTTVKEPLILGYLET